MEDTKRRRKIMQTVLIVGLTVVAVSCGAHLRQPDMLLALYVVAVLLILAGVTLNVWRSEP